MLGTHVTGLTLGIVGMGRIGQAVARRCHHGFGMPVLYYNRSPKAVELPARQVGVARRADAGAPTWSWWRSRAGRRRGA